jgi:catechol 2,3-dioxygenase-like lactoylglutathione lyase family enzyme
MGDDWGRGDMPKSKGLNHVAMSVPRGALTDDHVDEICDFYGRHLGWQVIKAYRQPDRLTLAVGGRTYVNIRERDDVMVCHGYEHFGITLESEDDIEQLWHDLRADTRDVEVGELETSEDGFRVFRFRYLLPLTVEVQYFPPR